MVLVNADKIKADLLETAVVGVYYHNGVFDEDSECFGISFVLDHLIYEMLQSNFAIRRNYCVWGHTSYGYSGFQVSCPTEKVNDTISLIEHVLYEHPLINNNLSEWFQICRKIAPTKPTSLENQYYGQRLPNNPLSKTLSSRMYRVPSWEHINEWRKKYVNRHRIACYITGACYEDTSRKESSIFSDFALPCFSAKVATSPKHIPYRRTNIVYSLPYSLTASNILAAEAYCEMVRPKIASTINSQGGNLCSVVFHPDYVPELRVHFHVKHLREWSAVHQVERDLLDTQIITPKHLFEAKDRIHSFYCKMHEDPIAWNRFAGYNLMSGNRYDLLELRDICAYDTQVTQDTVFQIINTFQVEEKRNVFMAAVR